MKYQTFLDDNILQRDIKSIRGVNLIRGHEENDYDTNQSQERRGVRYIKKEEKKVRYTYPYIYPM